MSGKKMSDEPKSGFFSFLKREQNGEKKSQKEQKMISHGLPALTEKDFDKIEAESRYYHR